MSVDRIGPYELRGEIGRGAMARVWKGYDLNLDRVVAIKEPLLDDNLPSEIREELAKRFVREAKAAAKVREHRNIVSVYAADVYDGRAAIVMEFVEGYTLTKFIKSSKKLDSQLIQVILEQLLDGIGYAHSKGIIHRDVKPDNIFISEDGLVKIGDFGIARMNEGRPDGTQIGVVLGTPGYMAPEQARGAIVDARSDLFAVGVIGYEMLTGSNPFRAEYDDPSAVLYRIVHEDVPYLDPNSFPGCSPHMIHAIMAALNKDPNMRPSSAAEMKAILRGERYDPANPPTIIPTPVPNPMPNKTSLPSWAPYAIVGGVGALILFFIFMTAGGSHGGGPAPGPGPVTPVKQMVEVPNVVGESDMDAVEDLSKLQLEYTEVGLEYSSKIPEGSVIKQEPEAGEQVEEGTNVEVVLSKGEKPVVQKGPRINEKAFKSSDGYILPDADKMAYSTKQLSVMSNKELCLARNEIYARHGRMFASPPLQSFFNGKDWYVGRYSPNSFSDKSLNSMELKNYNTIHKLEESRNSKWATGVFQSW